MPQRLSPLINGEIYHVFNRGSRKQKIFFDHRDYERALAVLEFYSYKSNSMKYSSFKKLPPGKQLEYLEGKRLSRKKIIECLAFCFMPNHFHLLIKQLEDKGISEFMRLIQNSSLAILIQSTTR